MWRPCFWPYSVDEELKTISRSFFPPSLVAQTAFWRGVSSGEAALEAEGYQHSRRASILHYPQERSRLFQRSSSCAVSSSSSSCSPYIYIHVHTLNRILTSRCAVAYRNSNVFCSFARDKEWPPYFIDFSFFFFFGPSACVWRFFFYYYYLSPGRHILVLYVFISDRLQINAIWNGGKRFVLFVGWLVLNSFFFFF